MKFADPHHRWPGSAGLKSTLEQLLARGGPADIAERVVKRDTILAFHNVVPDEASSGGDDALHLHRSRFHRYLDLLQEQYEVVSLARIVDEPVTGEVGRPRVAITFDDAYRGALILALPELAERGLPSTVFVPPGLLGMSSFWWDGVSAPDGGPIRGSLRDEALQRFHGDGGQVVKWARKIGFGERETHPMARPASLPELDWAAELPGVTIGAHGWWHRNLASLSSEHLSGELTLPLTWLGQRYARTLPVIAYPYGLTSVPVQHAAAKAGYRAGFLCGGGRLSRTSHDRMALPRVSVPAGLTSDGLRLRLTGIVEG
jgi:peptidoglycan/xylan/chitin deacetylase (PgdA/CDA1 family)